MLYRIGSLKRRIGIGRSLWRVKVFLQRKRFMALFRQYTVTAPLKTAMQVAEQVNPWLWRILNLEDYSNETGLAHLLENELDPACTII